MGFIGILKNFAYKNVRIKANYLVKICQNQIPMVKIKIKICTNFKHRNISFKQVLMKIIFFHAQATEVRAREKYY